MSHDPVAEAIARASVDARASEAKPPEQRVAGDIALPSGRHVGINLPADLSDAEFLDLIAILTTQVRANAQANRANAHPARSRILVPM